MMKHEKAALLQLFAEGGEGSAATGVTEAAAAPQETDGLQQPQEDLSAEFENLIKGKYKRAYDARVRDIVTRRLKGAKQQAAEGEIDAESVRLNAEKLCDCWIKQEEETRAYYPDFDMRLLLQDATFRKLLRSGIDVRTAYEVLSRDRILPAAMDLAVKAAQRLAAKRIASRAARPDENAMGGTGGTLLKTDVSKLTRSDIADVSRRLARGERISFS